MYPAYKIFQEAPRITTVDTTASANPHVVPRPEGQPTQGNSAVILVGKYIEQEIEGNVTLRFRQAVNPRGCWVRTSPSLQETSFVKQRRKPTSTYGTSITDVWIMFLGEKIIFI